jgi:hypothetical protein
VPVTHFNYDLIDGNQAEASVSMSEVSCAFVRLLDWCLQNQDLKSAGAKLAALQTFLDPVHAQFSTLAEIGRAGGFSRSLVCHWLMRARDACGIGLNLRGPDARRNCSEAQRLAAQNGHHSSNFRRKNSTGAGAPESHEGADMNQSVKERFRTLDAATDEIARLETQLATRQSKPAVTSTTITTTIKAAPKAPGPPNASPKPAPALGDLSDLELKAALDLSNRAKDADTTKLLYDELCRRRN